MTVSVGVGSTTWKVMARTVLLPLLITSTVTVSGPGESGAVYRTDGAVEDESLPLDDVHLNWRSVPEAWMVRLADLPIKIVVPGATLISLTMGDTGFGPQAANSPAAKAKVVSRPAIW